MRDATINVLLEIGIPAGLKGFTYICEAMELFDTEPYYKDGKICSLYADIGKRYNTTAARVERAIRHAFEIALQRGDAEKIESYLGASDRKNSNLLRTLYIRLTQKKQQEQEEEEILKCETSETTLKDQLYKEIMDEISKEVEQLILQTMQKKMKKQG